MKSLNYVLMIFFCLAAHSQNIIDITVKGISDSNKDGAQKDRMEATLDAKRQACEKAGIKIESKTQVKNFQTTYDLVESKSESILLPGFQIIDIGYVNDGTYQIVLSGKIKKLEEDIISVKELRYAKSLNDRRKYSKCREILVKYIDTHDKDISEDFKEQSFYYFLKWGYAIDLDEEYEKFRAYYPESKYLDDLKAFKEFANEPLYKFSKVYNLKKGNWKKRKYEHENYKFDKQIIIENETINFKDFKNREHYIIIKYSFYLNSDETENYPVADHLKISYSTSNISKSNKHGDNASSTEIIYEKFKAFSKKGSKSFQITVSDKFFSNFKLSELKLKGTVPLENKTFEQLLEFNVYQRAF